MQTITVLLNAKNKFARIQLLLKKLQLLWILLQILKKFFYKPSAVCLCLLLHTCRYTTTPDYSYAPNPAMLFYAELLKMSWAV